MPVAILTKMDFVLIYYSLLPSNILTSLNVNRVFKNLISTIKNYTDVHSSKIFFFVMCALKLIRYKRIIKKSC